MPPSVAELSHLTNPLASPEQLTISASQLDGVPADLERSIKYASQKLMQSAGILLRLPQEIIAEAIVVYTRVWVGAEGASLLQHQTLDVAAAAFYLVCKPSAYPITARQVLTVFRYLETTGSHDQPDSKDDDIDAEACFMSEGSFQIERTRLMRTELEILRFLGFQTHVTLPHALCIIYMQTLEFVTATSGHELANRAWAHLNSSLFNPQLLYLTHQPYALATAAIYLAAREVGTKLPEVEWWEIFDVDREELGFLVLALNSMANFAEKEAHDWKGRKVPTSFDDIKAEIETGRMLQSQSNGIGE